ncbi:MAG: AI-2E family transporter [Chitinivibrionales bacterium]|nr:AI-2E family transporter [Chitinivibrionales bacterium]
MDDKKQSTGRKAQLAIAPVIVIALVAGIYLLKPMTLISMLIFAGILAAIMFDGIVGLLCRYVHLNRIFSLISTVLLFIILLAGTFTFIGPNIIEQAIEVFDQIPEAASKTKSILLNYSWGDIVWNRLTQVDYPASQIFDRIGSAFSSTIGVIGNVLIIFFIGLFMAFRPSVYINGFIKLIPQARRSRIREVLSTIGFSLRRWLLARCISMFVIGLLTLAGYLILDVQLALALAVIAGLLSFVPYIGPALGVVPALIVTVADKPVKVLYVLAVYIVIQTLESYLITPLIEQQATSVPAAFLIIIQIIMAVAGGLMGILIATPLAVAGIVAVKMLYVEDVLHDSA